MLGFAGQESSVFSGFVSSTERTALLAAVRQHPAFANVGGLMLWTVDEAPVDDDDGSGSGSGSGDDSSGSGDGSGAGPSPTTTRAATPPPTTTTTTTTRGPTRSLGPDDMPDCGPQGGNRSCDEYGIFGLCCSDYGYCGGGIDFCGDDIRAHWPVNPECDPQRNCRLPDCACPGVQPARKPPQIVYFTFDVGFVSPLLPTPDP